MDTKLIRQKAIKRYVDEGFVLVKLRPNSKMPMEKNWVNLPYRKKFMTSNNFGVVLQHNQIVIDVDPRNFKNGDSFAKLKEKVDLPRTFIVRTGAGGFHYYYNKPASLVCLKGLPEYTGIEFKSKGNQVVGAGSIHPDTGNMYVPYDGTKISDMVDAPIELLNMLTVKDERTGSPRQRPVRYTEDEASITRFHHFLKSIGGAIEGEHGDEKTYTVAAFGKDLGLAPDTTYQMMIETWNEKCQPPWGMRELKNKVKNAYDYGVNDVGCLTYKNVFEDDEIDSIPTIVRNKDGLIVNNFVNACYFLGSPEIKYIGAGETTINVHKNPLGGLLRYNTLTNKIEFSSPAPWHKAKNIDDLIWKPSEVTDPEIINIKYNMDEITGLRWNRADIQDAVVKVAHEKSYNPVTNWLDGLNWDGEKRLDRWLTNYCGVSASNYTKEVGSKTLIAAVARAYSAGVKFDHMLVLEGEQGIGKSTVVNILAGDWYRDIMLRSDSKDTVQLINGAWIIEVSEMAGLRKAEVESLKAFISRTTDSIRPPFGKTPMDYPRRSIFIGTINPSSLGYLNDETGNRRYWPVNCKKINMSSLKRDRDQLFAEAVVRFKAGEKLFITDYKVREQAVRMQETRSLQHPWFKIIEDYFEEYEIKRIKVKDLYLDALCGDISRFRYTDKSLILTALKRLGWKRNKSGEYVNPKIENKVNKLVDEL